MSPTRKASSVRGGLRGAVTASADPDSAPLNLEAAADFIAETAALVEQQQRRPRPEKPAPVRFTLDLDREQHRFLKTHAADIDAKASEVMRALLDELRDDPALADRVRTRVWQSLVDRAEGR